MADKMKLANNLIQIQAGQSVSDFLADINDNFEKIPIITNAPHTIHVSTQAPSNEQGDNGDIWIVYEQPEGEE